MNKGNLDAIHHLAIHVANIQQSVDWYQSSFSCEVIEQEPTYARLKFQNIELVLSLPSKQPKHLGFVKEDAGTYGELQLQEDGERSTMVADPTGNVVELISP